MSTRSKLKRMNAFHRLDEQLESYGLRGTLRFDVNGKPIELTGIDPYILEQLAEEVRVEHELPRSWIEDLCAEFGTSHVLRGRAIKFDFRSQVSRVNEAIDVVEEALWTAFGRREQYWDVSERINSEWSREDSVRIGKRLLDLIQLASEISTDTAFSNSADDALTVWLAVLGRQQFQVRWMGPLEWEYASAAATVEQSARVVKHTSRLDVSDRPRWSKIDAESAWSNCLEDEDKAWESFCERRRENAAGTE